MDLETSTEKSIEFHRTRIRRRASVVTHLHGTWFEISEHNFPAFHPSSCIWSYFSPRWISHPKNGCETSLSLNPPFLGVTTTGRHESCHPKNWLFQKPIFFVSRTKNSSPQLQPVDPTADFSILFLKVTPCKTNIALKNRGWKSNFLLGPQLRAWCYLSFACTWRIIPCSKC